MDKTLHRVCNIFLYAVVLFCCVCMLAKKESKTIVSKTDVSQSQREYS